MHEGSTVLTAVSDVNWMLSAMVQSGAALVAIVGGIVGSRYVSIDAEQRAAERQLEMAEERRSGAFGRAEAARVAWIDYRVADLLDDDRCYEAVSQAQDRVTLEEVLTEADIAQSGVPRDRLEARLTLIQDVMKEAVTTLEGCIVESEDPLDWETLRRAHSLNTSAHDDVWRWCYDEIVKRNRRRRSKSRWGMLPMDLQMPVLTPPAWRVAHESRLIDERDASQRLLDVAEDDRRFARLRLEESIQPEGFALALWVLSYLAFVSIAVPLALMIPGWVTISLWARVVVSALFLSGVALLLRFLFVYASYLRRHSGRESLPRTPFGLVYSRRG